MLTHVCATKNVANRIKNLNKLLLILSERPVCACVCARTRACVCVCVHVCARVRACVCFVNYIISTTQKLQVTEIHNTYHVNEKMFWD